MFIVEEVTVTCSVSYPMADTVRLAPMGTVIVKLPSRSAAAPLVVPVCMTAAPITGCFAGSRTVPFTVMVFWADSIDAPRTMPASTENSRLNKLLVFIMIIWLNNR